MKRSCKACKEELPPGVRRCEKCGAYQHWMLFWVPVAASLLPFLTLITAVISAWFYFSEYHSDTHFKVATADADRILLKAWNTGHKPSTLTGFRLVFDSLPDRELTLTLSPRQTLSATNVIESGTPVMIELQQQEKSLLSAEENRRQYSTINVHQRKYFAGQKATLYVDVQESNDDAGEHHVRIDHFFADRISAFIKARWP